MYSQCSEAVFFMSYLNFAVSGSISSSSLTGERGTLAENFSVIGEGMKIGEVERDGIMTIQLTTTEVANYHECLQSFKLSACAAHQSRRINKKQK